MTIGKSRRCEAFSGQQSQGRCYDKSCLILTALFMVSEPGDWEKCVYQPIATLCARLSAINAAYTLDKSNTAWNLNKLQKMKQSLNQTHTVDDNLSSRCARINRLGRHA